MGSESTFLPLFLAPFSKKGRINYLLSLKNYYFLSKKKEITITATIRPTNPPLPKVVTRLVIFATTSPMMIVLPNNRFATTPNPSNDTKIAVTPDTKSLAIFITLFIKIPLLYLMNLLVY